MKRKPWEQPGGREPTPLAEWTPLTIAEPPAQEMEFRGAVDCGGWKVNIYVELVRDSRAPTGKVER